MWVRIPLETYIFILNFSLPPRSEQVNGDVANEIKHVHSPEVIVVLDPRYDLSYKALYISTCSIALTRIASRSFSLIYVFVCTPLGAYLSQRVFWQCSVYHLHSSSHPFHSLYFLIFFPTLTSKVFTNASLISPSPSSIVSPSSSYNQWHSVNLVYAFLGCPSPSGNPSCIWSSR